MGAPKGNKNAAGPHHGSSKKNAYNAKFHIGSGSPVRKFTKTGGRVKYNAFGKRKK